MTKKWLAAFEKVQKTIKELNGEWNPDWMNHREEFQFKHVIYYRHTPHAGFDSHIQMTEQYSFLLPCRSRDIVHKVIARHMSELKTLFEVKNKPWKR